MKKIRGPHAKILVSSLSLLLFSGGCSATPKAEPHPPQAPPAPQVSKGPSVQVSPAFHEVGRGSIADVVEGVLPSVVSVKSTKKAPVRSRRDYFFGAPGGGKPQQGLGSGVILSADGLVVTNNHVIDGATEVSVQTNDERTFNARVVGADPKSDVAVLQLEGELGVLTPARIGDSSALRLGDVVLAVGNPFGVGQTVTMGIVSATGRSDMGIVDYENFIQTDAAINPGNSGGALVNMRGELVGINTAILSRSGGSVGIGFAIPSNMADPIIDALRADGRVTRGWLGVSIQELDADLKKALSLGHQDGVLIADVAPDGPAHDAGLRSGDVVTQVDDQAVSTTGQFRNLIASAGANSKVLLRLVRAGKKKSIKVELGKLEREEGETKLPAVQSANGTEVEGLTFKTLDDELRRRLKVNKDQKGTVIVGVTRGSKAERAGLRPGDLILEINQKPVTSAQEALKVYQSIEGARLLQILRRGSKHFVVVK